MNRNSFFPVVLLLGTYAIGPEVGAQGTSVTDDYLHRVIRETTERIDGQVEPEKVPRAFRLKVFFYRWSLGENAGYQAALAEILSASDHRVLSEYAAIHQAAVQEDDTQFEMAADVIVASSDGHSAMEVATKFEEASAQREQTALARYEKVLASLSPQGRAIIERYSFEKVRPKMTVSKPTSVAKRAPSLFLANVQERKEHIGEWRKSKGPVEQGPLEQQQPETMTTESTVPASLTKPVVTPEN